MWVGRGYGDYGVPGFALATDSFCKMSVSVISLVRILARLDGVNNP